MSWKLMCRNRGATVSKGVLILSTALYRAMGAPKTVSLLADDLRLGLSPEGEFRVLKCREKASATVCCARVLKELDLVHGDVLYHRGTEEWNGRKVFVLEVGGDR